MTDPAPRARVVTLTLSPSAFARASESAARRGDDLLIAKGQWPAEVDGGWADRIGLFDVSGGRPRLLLEGWVDRGAQVELAALLPGARSGGWDVMFATSWKWAWGGAPFLLWSRRGCRLTVAGPRRAVVQTLWWRREVTVDRVLAEVSEGWTRHRVGVACVAEGTIWLARRFELGPLVDLTYDGLCLLADCGWMQDLGSQLSSALEVPLVANDPAIAPPT
jgi:hypothetical protein